MPEQDNLDLLLDSALRTYGDPGADSGLSERILARVGASREAASTASPRRRWLLWAIAMPAAACVLLLVLSGPKKGGAPSGHAAGTLRSQNAPVVAAHDKQLPDARPLHTQATARRVPRKPHLVQVAAHPAPLPKLDVFPTPQPLTPEEQALVAFATQSPESERQALLEAQKKSNEPLRIAAIHISPLEPPAPGTN